MQSVYDAVLFDLDQVNTYSEIVLEVMNKALNSKSYLLFISKEKCWDNIKHFIPTNNKGKIFYFIKNSSTLFYDYDQFFLRKQKLTLHSEKEIVEILKRKTKSQNILKINEIKNISSINSISNKVRLVPAISIGDISRDSYASKLAFFMKNKKDIRKKLERINLETINDNHAINLEDFSSLLAQDGGLSFCDYELIILKKEESNHPIFNLFEVDCFRNKRKYCYNTDKGVVLRGPNNYYYNLCYIEENENSIIKPSIIFELPLAFLKKAVKELLNYKLDLNKISDMKVYLAVLDVLRNLITIQLYYFVKIKAENKNILYVFNDGNGKKNKEVDKLYNLLKNIYHLYLDSLYGFNKYTYENQLIELIENTLELQNEIIFSNYKVEKSKQFYKMRNWRETDNVIENIISISTSIDSLRKNGGKQSNYLYWGLNYGSLDLAILSEVISAYKGFPNSRSGIIIVNKSYSDVYNDDLSSMKGEFISEINSKNSFEAILIDDNIVSGKSLQAGINILALYYTTPKNAFVIRYPDIGRINQMNGPNDNCRTDLDLFDNYIRGLLYSTSFTKICDVELQSSYFDRMGVFDSMKQQTINYLFKNQIYCFNSLIDLRR